MNIAERVETARRVSGLTAQQLALMAGVAPSTVTRVESGTMRPTFDLAQSLLQVLGQSLDAVPYADRDAVAAARLAIDPTCPIVRSAGVDEWLARWSRVGLITDDGLVAASRRGDVARRAAAVSRLYRRSGLVDVPARQWWEVADVLDSSDLSWAVTGSVAANLFVESAGMTRPTFYVSDVAAAVRLIGAEPIPEGTYGPRVSLLPFDGIGEVGRYADSSGVTVAAFDQVVIDCFGGIGRMPEQADAMLQSVAGAAI